MPRITVYVPDNLKARMDEVGDGLNWSAITQRAIGEAIATQSLRRNPSDMTSVINRLRASKQRAVETNEAYGKEAGAKWARENAEYEELNRVWVVVDKDRDIDLDSLQALIDPDSEMDTRDWQEFWDGYGFSQTWPDNAFAAGFAMGAHDVFEEVKDQL